MPGEWLPEESLDPTCAGLELADIFDLLSPGQLALDVLPEDCLLEEGVDDGVAGGGVDGTSGGVAIADDLNNPGDTLGQIFSIFSCYLTEDK